MKSLFVSLTLFTALLDHPVWSQDLKTNLKSPDHAVVTHHGKKIKPNPESKNQDAAKPDSLTENYQMLLEEYFQLPDKPAKNFVHTSDGKDYTGTKNGIIVWDGSQINITTENSNMPENNITTLALDKDDHLWIGTFSSGVVIGLGTCIKPYKIKPIKTRGLNIYSISSDEKGRVWVTFQNGEIECFRDGKSIAFFPKE